MKKTPLVLVIGLLLLTFSFFMIACQMETPGESLAGPADPTNPTEPAPRYAKEYWGEWLRMDAGETWYISSSAIKINNSNPPKTVSFNKQSDRVIEVTDGARKYYLYASRIANASFTGKIAGIQQESQSQRAVNGVSNAVLTITNLDNKVEKLTTTTDTNGIFTADNIIPGDNYEILINGQGTTVTPVADGDDIGTITVASGVNFKTGIKPQATSTDMGRLYANMNTYGFNLNIQNTGTEDCTAATYLLEFEDDLIPISVPSSLVLGTIEPGKTKTLEITLGCKPIQGEYEFKKIGITITDEINKTTWEDSVSLKFNKAPVNFNIRSNEAVSGIIITPSAKAYSFSTTNVASSTFSMPWSARDYLVVFSGATADTEAIYSIGINVTPDTNFTNFTDLGNYEPNNAETAATAINMQDKIMSYLHKNDIDYYTINLGANAPQIKPAAITDFAYTSAGGNGDDTIQPHESGYLDIRVRNNTNASVNITSTVLSTTSSYVTLDQNTGTIGDLTAGYYKTLTYASYSSYYASSASLLYSLYLTQAFKFTIADDCPVGTDLPFTVTFTDSWGNVWTDTLIVPVVGTEASIAINTPITDNYRIREAANGNADGKANARETHYLDIRIKNTGTSNALGLSAVLTTTSVHVTIDQETAAIGDLTAGYYKTLTYASYSSYYASSASLLYSLYLTQAFKFTIADDCPIGTDLPFTVTFTDSWGNVWTDTLTIPVMETGS